MAFKEQMEITLLIFFFQNVKDPPNHQNVTLLFCDAYQEVKEYSMSFLLQTFQV